MPLPCPSTVALRWEVLQEARRVVASNQLRTASSNKVSRELTPEVLAAFAEGATEPSHQLRTASIGRRLKQLWNTFQKSPQKWEDFKRMLGVKATNWMGVARELPGKIKKMFSDGKKWLERAGRVLIEKIPLLKIYFDVGTKLPGVGDWMKAALKYAPPSVQKAVNAITSRVTSLAGWIDQLLKRHPVLTFTGVAVSAAVFAIIWFNVTEISWDLPEIIRGFLGGYSFVELVHSLPESALGFLISLLFPGIPGGLVWNVLLPITVALRLGYLVHKGYIKWSPGRELVILWDKLGIEPPEGVPSTMRV